MSYELAAKVKAAAVAWRAAGYEGATETTRRLLAFWFAEEHAGPDGTPFAFWRCQREAVEALIYVYEVCGYRTLYDAGRGLGVSLAVDPTQDRWPKYCFKMATGSGKTFVMAMAIAWQYFNRTRGEQGDWARHFLLLAPNLIVFDRLKADFADLKIFRKWPFLPPEWAADFALDVFFQSDVGPVTAPGALYLTNWHQLQEREPAPPANPIAAVLGPKPRGGEEIAQATLEETLAAAAREGLMVVNDEAHHVHTDELEWAKVINRLHDAAPLKMQLDFTATPVDPAGKPFAHVITNYTLRDAVEDNIVKRPRIGILENVPASSRKDFVARNRAQIDTGLRLLKEAQTKFKAVGLKPVLFIMTDNTRNADRVGEYLEREKGLRGKVLVIHTDSKGVITKKDLDRARVAAREIDKPENPYEVIVSVMMLKEGWDVRNVCVIVPLRAFDSPILPEQTLGRGLRRMAPQNADWREVLTVVDHPRFRDLWEAELEAGDIVGPADIKIPADNLIIPNLRKLQYDLEIPTLMGGPTRDAPDYAALDIRALPQRVYNLSAIEIKDVELWEKDLVTGKIEDARVIPLEYTDTFGLFLSCLCNRIKSHYGGSFHELYPQVKLYVEKYFAEREYTYETPEEVKKLNYPPVREKLEEILREAVENLARREEEPYYLGGYFKVSETKPFHTSEPVVRITKSVFDHLPYSGRSDFERRFMIWLDGRAEVEAFTKVLYSFPLNIPYYSAEGFIRHYRPDFIVKAEGKFYLIETKGMEDDKVPRKAEAARRWCRAVSKFRNEEWVYLKVGVDDFSKCETADFAALVRLAQN